MSICDWSPVSHQIFWLNNLHTWKIWNLLLEYQVQCELMSSCSKCMQKWGTTLRLKVKQFFCLYIFLVSLQVTSHMITNCTAGRFSAYISALSDNFHSNAYNIAGHIQIDISFRNINQERFQAEFPFMKSSFHSWKVQCSTIITSCIDRNYVTVRRHGIHM